MVSRTIARVCHGWRLPMRCQQGPAERFPPVKRKVGSNDRSYSLSCLPIFLFSPVLVSYLFQVISAPLVGYAMKWSRELDFLKVRRAGS